VQDRAVLIARPTLMTVLEAIVGTVCARMG
jgi:hypothetical protein